METEQPAHSSSDFMPFELAAKLMREIHTGMLATIEHTTQYPHATLTTVALDEGGVPLIFISALSAHTQNLLLNPRFSLLLAETGKGDPLAHPRLTLSGKAICTNSEDAKIRFIEQNPKAKLYADFPDFSLWRLMPETIHLNGGFAKAYQGSAEPLMHMFKPK